MKENDKMIYAIAISSAVAGGILDYQKQTKPPETPPVVQTVEQPKAPELKEQNKDNNNK